MPLPAESPTNPEAPPVHPRDVAIEAAAGELRQWIGEWALRHQLTAIEYLYLVGVLSHRQVQALCMQERNHNRPEVSAG